MFYMFANESDLDEYNVFGWSIHMDNRVSRI